MFEWEPCSSHRIVLHSHHETRGCEKHDEKCQEKTSASQRSALPLTCRVHATLNATRYTVHHATRYATYHTAHMPRLMPRCLTISDTLHASHVSWARVSWSSGMVRDKILIILRRSPPSHLTSPCSLLPSLYHLILFSIFYPLAFPSPLPLFLLTSSFFTLIPCLLSVLLLLPNIRLLSP